MGTEVNMRHRELLSSLGISHVTQRTTATATATVGSRYMTFGPSPVAVLKLLAVYNTTPGTYPPPTVNEVTSDQLLHMSVSSGDSPANYAVTNMGERTVTIQLDCIPATAFILTADVEGNITQLSGAMSPAFDENYHDILVNMVCADELEKAEKYDKAKEKLKQADTRMGALRLQIAKSAYKTLVQGGSPTHGGGGGGGSASGWPLLTAPTSAATGAILVATATNVIGTLPASAVAGSMVVSAGVGVVPAYKAGLGYINVKDYGAVGDGTTNDTTAIQAAITAATAGDCIWFPRSSGTYRLTAALTISKALTLEGHGVELHQVTGSQNVLSITASHVTVRGLTLSGPQFAAAASNLESGINALGASAAVPITDIRIEGCTIKTFGDYGIVLQFVNDFVLSSNLIQDVFYAGICITSCLRGTVEDNHIRNIVGTVNAYGITCSRDSLLSLVTAPRCRDIAIRGNLIEDVPVWEGIDTHGGENLSIAGNTIRNCMIGIAVTSSSNATLIAYAPLNVSVVGNVIESTVTNGTRAEGIQVIGAGITAGAAVQLASGCVVSGNSIRGHGLYNSTPGTGGMLFANTQGLVVNGNTLVEPAPFGINCWFNNYDAVISGNTIIDVWSDTVTVNQAVAIYLRDAANRVLITGNVMARGARVIAAGEKAFTTGIRTSGTAPLEPWILGINYCQGQSANYVFDATVSGFNGTLLRDTIFTDTTARSNVGVGVETDLSTFTLKAAAIYALTADGKGFKVKAWGVNAANANSKTKTLKIGGVSVTSRVSAANGTTWHYEAIVIRTGASAEVVWAANEDSNSGKAQTAQTLALDTTADIIIKMTGTSATASTDVTQNGMTVEVFP